MGNNSISNQRHFWNNFDWANGGDEWSSPWGSTNALWFGTLMPRIAANFPARTILEIAPGAGRFTQYLKNHCETYIGVDLSETCVTNCRRRFKAHDHMTFHVNDGLSLAMIADESIDFVFSHDSLVHAEADVLRSYVRQLATKLVPGGTGFIHFSNFLKVREREAAAGATASINVHARAENMSAELFAAYCQEAGLTLLALEVIDWGINESDALAFFSRLTSATEATTKVVVNDTFQAEAKTVRKVWELYSNPHQRIDAASPMVYTAAPTVPRRSLPKVMRVESTTPVDQQSPNLLTSDDITAFFTREGNRDPATLWVFQHIPKTAGSSLAKDLGSHFKPWCNLYPGALGSPGDELSYGEQLNATLKTFVETQPERGYRFANGHLNRQHIKLLQSSLPRVALFTILRDPFTRMISAYRYRQTPKSPDSASFIETYPTFESFLNAQDANALQHRNPYCRILVGRPDGTYEEAREILEREYVFCGLVETYPLSFAVISTLMGRYAAPERHENKTPDRVPNEVNNPRQYYEAIYEANSEDVKLYNFVKDRLVQNREAIWDYIKHVRAMSSVGM